MEMRTLHLRNVADDVTDRLERLARTSKVSVTAVTIRERDSATRRIDNAALVATLADLKIPAGSIVEAVQAERRWSFLMRPQRWPRCSTTAGHVDSSPVSRCTRLVLVDAEVVSALWRLVGAGTLNGDDGYRCVGACSRIGLLRYAAGPLLRCVWGLREGVSASDVLYVALAQRLDCALVTIDAQRSRALGRQCAITLVPDWVGQTSLHWTESFCLWREGIRCCGMHRAGGFTGCPRQPADRITWSRVWWTGSVAKCLQSS